MIFTSSKSISHEYCATIVRIGELKPVEGSDFLAQTLVNGLSIVVRKDEVHEGDLMIYAANETVLSAGYLSVNNLYEISERDRNSNVAEVERLLEEGKTDEAKRKCGFFNKHGRVKMIRLRGCPSMGFLLSLESLAKWKPECAGVDLEPLVGTDFDEVAGEKFIKVYVPDIPQRRQGGQRNYKKRMKKIDKFDRMIPGQFAFHYDTNQLNREMRRFNPDSQVSITLKMHGTSAIFANILVKRPWECEGYGWFGKALTWMNKKLPIRFQKKVEEYGNVYSSRTVIKNQYINHSVGGGYYGTDVWEEYNELLKPIIPKGMTVYGEILGYISGSTEKMIQKKFDYGCEPGKNKIMFYRIKTVDPETKETKEWNIREVREWTIKLMNDHPEIADRIQPIVIFWYGRLGDYYPNFDPENHWQEDVLEAMKNEPRWGMEKPEPLCKNKVPRDGIVLRLIDDPTPEAWKLKCIKFLEKEKTLIDAGEVDIEMQQGYADAEEEYVE